MDTLPPTPEKIVYTLAKHLRTELKAINAKDGSIFQRQHHVFLCPNEHCREPNREIYCQKNKGFCNPARHLRACLADGDDGTLIDMYNDAKKRKTDFGVEEYFKSKVTPRVKAIYAYLLLIIMHNMPLSIVEMQNVRNFSKYTEKFSRATLRKVILKLTELVEQRISRELKAAHVGTILHDGWSYGGVHYIGLFASYIRQVGICKADKINQTQDVVELTLLSCAPMGNTDTEDNNGSEEDYDVKEAVEFSAATHVKHIHDMFRFYDVDVKDWVVCQVADNCRVNKKVALLLGIPHVGCKSHLLNLEVNFMVRMVPDLEKTLDSIHQTMLQCKQRLRNAALLRNIVELRPIIHNKTRWSGKFL